VKNIDYWHMVEKLELFMQMHL